MKCFAYFPGKQGLTFYANCLQWRKCLYEKTNPVILEKKKEKKNIINLSSAELAQSGKS